jgi:hypothetical protein
VAGAKVKGFVAVPQAFCPMIMVNSAGACESFGYAASARHGVSTDKKRKKAAEGFLQPEDSGVMARPETET